MRGLASNIGSAARLRRSGTVTFSWSAEPGESRVTTASAAHEWCRTVHDRDRRRAPTPRQNIACPQAGWGEVDALTKCQKSVATVGRWQYRRPNATVPASAKRLPMALVESAPVVPGTSRRSANSSAMIAPAAGSRARRVAALSRPRERNEGLDSRHDRSMLLRDARPASTPHPPLRKSTAKRGATRPPGS